MGSEAVHKYRSVLKQRRDETEEAIFFKNKADFDHLFDSDKTPDAINDLLMTTVTNASCSLLAKRPKDANEWVIRSRAQVTHIKNKGYMKETKHFGEEVRPRRR